MGTVGNCSSSQLSLKYIRRFQRYKKKKCKMSSGISLVVEKVETAERLLKMFSKCKDVNESNLLYSNIEKMLNNE